METYMFVYLKTGGGHLAPAKAIAEKMKEDASASIDIRFVDGLDNANSTYRHSIEEGYRYSVNNAPWGYKAVYAFHKLRPVTSAAIDMAMYFMTPHLEQQILELRPRKIVIFHFLLIKPVNEIVARHGLDSKITVVVTDPFTAHPIWFAQPGQLYIVFSQELRDKCVAEGIEEQKIKVFPFATNPKFSQRLTDFEIIKAKLELGFDLNKKVVLVMGGGEGMPRGEEILRNLLKHNIEAEVAVVCGKNQKLLDQCNELKRRYALTNVKVYGFVDFVHTLVGISDVVVTKCGASTFMEILMMGKVPIINNYIWEQEKGNMEYVCRNQMGIFESDTRKLPQVVKRVLTDETVYASLTRNIDKAGLRNGAEHISEYLINN